MGQMSSRNHEWNIFVRNRPQPSQSTKAHHAQERRQNNNPSAQGLASLRREDNPRKKRKQHAEGKEQKSTAIDGVGPLVGALHADDASFLGARVRHLKVRDMINQQCIDSTA